MNPHSGARARGSRLGKVRLLELPAGAQMNLYSRIDDRSVPDTLPTRSPRRVRLRQSFMDKRLRSSGRDLATTPAPLPVAARSEHPYHRLSVYE
jgi:hypothetical protein